MSIKLSSMECIECVHRPQVLEQMRNEFDGTRGSLMSIGFSILFEILKFEIYILNRNSNQRFKGNALKNSGSLKKSDEWSSNNNNIPKLKFFFRSKNSLIVFTITFKVLYTIFFRSKSSIILKKFFYYYFTFYFSLV